VETAILDRIPSLSVVTPRSLGDKVEIDLIKACQGNDDASCTAQFSEALGVELVLRPSLSRLGDVLILTLSLYDTRSAAVLSQGQRQAARDQPEELLSQIPGLVEEIGTRAGLEVRREVKKPFPTAAVAAVSVGGALVLGGAGLAGFALWQELRYQGAELSRDDAASWESARLLVVGGAALVGLAGSVLVGYGAMKLLE
jgi:hypothetical protein